MSSAVAPDGTLTVSILAGSGAGLALVGDLGLTGDLGLAGDFFGDFLVVGASIS